jgi:cardiolipin synthase
MSNRILTISNAISALRVVLVVPIAYFLLTGKSEDRILAAWLVLFAIATDFLDGFLARKLHQVSELGKIIDPLADKIAVGTVAILLAITGDIALWYLGVVLARDFFILAGGIFINRKKRIIPQSNWPGKIAVTVVAIYLFVCLWSSILLMSVSTISYAQRLFIGRNISPRS